MRFNPSNPRPDGFNETRDCVVRALSLAFNRPYAEVHEICARVGRKRRRGMYRSQTNQAIKILTGDDMALGTSISRYDGYPTFAQFAKDNPKGHFLVIKSGHAVALIDGVYHDIGAGPACSPRCRVQFYYQVK